MALADLHGRRRLVLEAKALESRQPADVHQVLFSAGETLAPGSGQGFTSAAEILARRTPELARPMDGEPLWRAVARLYERSDRVFSMAQRGERVVARHTRSALERIGITREALQRVISRGLTSTQFEDAMMEMQGFSRSYAETVFRTNMNTAYTDGRFEQAKDPDVQQVIGAFEYMAVTDSAVRDTHATIDGVTAAVTHPIWETIRPPNGYNCRCTVRLVDKRELRDKGLITPEGHVKPVKIAQARAFEPDEGFRKEATPGVY